MNDLVTRTGFRFSTRPATPADAMVATVDSVTTSLTPSCTVKSPDAGTAIDVALLQQSQLEASKATMRSSSAAHSQ